MGSKAVPTKLYIGNLPDLCRKEELQAKFEKYGNVVEFDIVKNYGFAHYETASEALAAANALNGIQFGGSTITVEVSHSKVRQKPGMGGKGECFRCGEEGHWSKDCPKLGPRKPRPPPRASAYPDPYDDPYYGDPYADPYYRARYMPPPPPGYDPYDPYDRRPLLPPPRDPYLRDRIPEPYLRPPPEYYARRSPPPHPDSPPPRDPFARDPLMNTRDLYVSRDPYHEYYERRRAYLSALRPAPYAKPGSNGQAKPATSMGRVPGPY